MRAESRSELYNIIDGVLDERAEIDAYLKKTQRMYSPSRGYPAEYRTAMKIADGMVDEWVKLASKTASALEHVFKGAGAKIAYDMANTYRKAKESTGTAIVLEGLQKALGIARPAIIFRYATVGGDTVYALVNYFKKKNWGDIVEMIENPELDDSRRIWLHVHEDNPYRVVAATRNEMKWALGKGGPRLVQRSYRDTKREFMSGLTDAEKAWIEDNLAMTPDEFRQAAKKGSTEVAGALAAERIARSREGTDAHAARGEITGLPYVK